MAASVITDRYALYNGDCVTVMGKLPSESAGMALFSPPFADLYCYSDSDLDLSNNRSYEDFFEHFGFVAAELFRILCSGRVAAIHCWALPIFKCREGYEAYRDFPGDIIRLFERHGFVLHCPPVTVWKDPLIAATRTHAKHLAHQQLVKDSAACGIGGPDLIVLMRKPGDNKVPVKHPQGLTTYAGSKSVPTDLSRYEGWKDQRTNKRSHWIWQQYASPVWFDIRLTRVLPYKAGREKDDQKHICPLQLDVIERCCVLWTNPDEVVLTPFMGVGSEVYGALLNGRKGVGIELKETYFRQAVRNCREVVRTGKQPKLGVSNER